MQLKKATYRQPRGSRWASRASRTSNALLSRNQKTRMSLMQQKG